MTYFARPFAPRSRPTEVLKGVGPNECSRFLKTSELARAGSRHTMGANAAVYARRVKLSTFVRALPDFTLMRSCP